MLPITAFQRLVLAECLAELRAQAFEEIPTERLFGDKLRSAELFKTLEALSEELALGLAENFDWHLQHHVSLGDAYDLSPVEERPRTFSAHFGEFQPDLDFVDVYSEENAFLLAKENKKLLVRVASPVRTPRELLTAFSNLGVELTSLFTRDGKMVYDGFSKPDRDIRAFCLKRGAGNAYFGVLVADNDDGEELPAIRLWWAPEPNE